MKKSVSFVPRLVKKAIPGGFRLDLMSRMNFFLTTFFALGIIIGAVLFYRHSFVRIADGTVFRGLDLSGMSRSEVRELIDGLAVEWSNSDLQILVDYDGDIQKAQVLSMSDLGLSYDVPAIMAYLFQGSVLLENDEKSFAASSVHGAAPLLSVDYAVLGKILDVVKAYERPPRNADIVFNLSTGAWELQAAERGYAFQLKDRPLLVDHLRGLITVSETTKTLNVPLGSVLPEVTTEDLLGVYDELNRLLQREVRWSLDGVEKVFALRDYPQIIRLDIESRRVEVDEDLLKSSLEVLLLEQEKPVTGVLISDPQADEKGVWRSDYSGSFQQGRTFDLASFYARFSDVLFERVEGKEPVLLESQLIAPEVLMEDGVALELLARGRSSYVLGEDPDRVFNIAFGLEKYDGVVIPQREEFSFNKILGWVTYADGWKPAFAIFGGGGVTKVPGGGLCQVSTTVFRAAVRNGLPVTQRRPHSLDVSYYHKYGYGIDATIYPPNDIDLKFVNDTPGPIFIHAYLDEGLKEVFVDFYGIDDGREVSLKQVENYVVRLPDDIRYTDNIMLGYQEVLKKGRVGRYIEWDWKIKKSDGSVENRVIETLYPAQRRTVLVGEGS